MSSLLERRINAARQRDTSSAPTIVNEIHLPSEFGPRSAPPSSASSSRFSPLTDKGPEKLVTGPIGLDMDVRTFCKQFDLDDCISDRLVDQGYKKTKTFQHITIEGLKEMSFKPGEIASLQVAVAEWAEVVT